MNEHPLHPKKLVKTCELIFVQSCKDRLFHISLMFAALTECENVLRKY